MALEKPTQQSSQWSFGTNELPADSSKAVDGCTETIFQENCCTHTSGQAQPWLAVDLLFFYKVQMVKVLNREMCCGKDTTFLTE